MKSLLKNKDFFVQNQLVGAFEMEKITILAQSKIPTSQTM